MTSPIPKKPLSEAELQELQARADTLNRLIAVAIGKSAAVLRLSELNAAYLLLAETVPLALRHLNDYSPFNQWVFWDRFRSMEKVMEFWIVDFANELRSVDLAMWLTTKVVSPGDDDLEPNNPFTLRAEFWDEERRQIEQIEKKGER